MDTPQNIPLSHIDTTTLPRDRTFIDADAQQELQASIKQNGLRLPVEVYATETGYALISGYRRLHAFQSLAEITQSDQYTSIPALVRTPVGKQAALAAMVEENEIRQNLSPWERARIAVTTHQAQIFETLDAALATLYPQISRQKRSKLRAVTEVVEALDGHLTDPERLTENQLIRLAQCLRLDWGEIICTAIGEQRDPTSTAQWHRLLPIMQEAETLVAQNHSTNPSRPRRLSRPRAGLSVRREVTREGYLLHITGTQAKSTLVTSVLEDIERLLGDE